MPSHLVKNQASAPHTLEASLFWWYGLFYECDPESKRACIACHPSALIVISLDFFKYLRIFIFLLK